MRINDFRLSEHFRLREFQCRCCGTAKLSAKLVEKLEELRAAWGAPLVITSGYRCPSHNAEVGGARGSLHLLGQAADISARLDDQEHLKYIALKANFHEVICGKQKGYIHVGIR